MSNLRALLEEMHEDGSIDYYTQGFSKNEQTEIKKERAMRAETY